MVHSEIEAAIDKFRQEYGIPPNVVTVGYEVAHELRVKNKYTMLFKPVKIDKWGNMTINNIPIVVNYEYPKRIEIALKMTIC